MVLSLLTTLTQLSSCPLFKPLDFKKVANVFLGKFIDQTFHVVEHIRSRVTLKFIDTPWGGVPTAKNN